MSISVKSCHDWSFFAAFDSSLCYCDICLVCCQLSLFSYNLSPLKTQHSPLKTLGQLPCPKGRFLIQSFEYSRKTITSAKEVVLRDHLFVCFLADYTNTTAWNFMKKTEDESWSNLKPMILWDWSGLETKIRIFPFPFSIITTYFDGGLRLPNEGYYYKLS